MGLAVVKKKFAPLTLLAQKKDYVMLKLGHAAFAHTIISTSDSAIAYCYWHCAKYIFAKWRPELKQPKSPIGKALSFSSFKESNENFDLCIRILYGAREKALLMISRSIGRPLSEQELQELVGLNINESPFTNVFLSETKARNRQFMAVSCESTVQHGRQRSSQRVKRAEMLY